MPRGPRNLEPDICYHILNRGNGRQRLFHKPGDYQAFVTVLTEALARFEVDLLCWCLMPNHWHLVLRPRRRGALSAFMQWLTITHVRRHHAHYRNAPPGHLYQGRFKSFPVETDEYFLALCRYVEANALRGRLVARAQAWRWSSLHQRSAPPVEGGKNESPPMPRLTEWPVDRPADGAWINLVNEPLADDQRARVQRSLRRASPLGSDAWVRRISKRLGMTQSIRPLGRPPKPMSQLSERQLRRRKQNKSGQNGA